MLNVMEFTTGSLCKQLSRYYGSGAKPKISGEFTLLSPRPFGNSIGNFVRISQRAKAYPSNRDLLVAPEEILSMPEKHGINLSDVVIKRRALPEFQIPIWGEPDKMVIPLRKYEYLQLAIVVRVYDSRFEQVILILAEKQSAIYRISSTII